MAQQGSVFASHITGSTAVPNLPAMPDIFIQEATKKKHHPVQVTLIRREITYQGFIAAHMDTVHTQSHKHKHTPHRDPK